MPNGNGHAENIGALLTQKWGGVPVYVYVIGAAAVGGGLIWYFNKQQTAKAAASGQDQSSQAAASNASSMFPVPPVTYVTGIPDSATGLNSSSPTGAATQPSTIAVGPTPGQPNQGVFSQAVAAYPGPSSTGQYTLLPFGNYPVAGNVQNGLYPVKGPGGQTLWVLGQNVSSFTGGGGGLGGIAPASSPWESFSQRWHVPQYIFGGMGGAGAGGPASNVHHLARRTKLPAARLQAMNPHLRQTRGRIGPSTLVRIA